MPTPEYSCYENLQLRISHAINICRGVCKCAAIRTKFNWKLKLITTISWYVKVLQTAQYLVILTREISGTLLHTTKSFSIAEDLSTTDATILITILQTCNINWNIYHWSITCRSNHKLLIALSLIYRKGIIAAQILSWLKLKMR